VFFDECHIAITDTSYQERLRELWRLRYLDCPFTGLTATLMVELEEVLRERLSIDNAIIFRRSTARRTIRYQVIDSKEEAPSVVATQIVQGLQLPKGKRGVIYVQSYTTGAIISKALDCPFYKARVDDKGAVLQEWMHRGGGWIVATGALGTGINIEGIIYVIHVDWPYGLTSFVQQSGQGGRNGEVSDSMIIARVQHSSKHKRKEVTSDYSVKSADKEAMVAFMQSKTCRRQVLSHYLDKESSKVDCKSTDSVFCNHCKVYNRGRVGPEGEEVKGDNRSRIHPEGEEVKGGYKSKLNEEQDGEQEPSGQQMIRQRLRALEEEHKNMIKVMNRLQGQCIYCMLIHKQGHRSFEELHEYTECLYAKADKCRFEAYKQWRKRVSFGQAKHCWECGLSQRICRRLEKGRGKNGKYEACEYTDIVLPSIFVLHQQQHLAKVVKAVGFQGEYNSDDLGEWLNETAEGFGWEWESNWMET